MQNADPSQLVKMTGPEYQVYLSEPPLYIIRKVDRKSPFEVVELAYYYILNGIVYQSPDFLSVISSRLQTSISYLQDGIETIFTNYKYHPSKGYYWNFNQGKHR
jgi:mediator of RNA polymerase II transcription subunit 6